MYGPGTRHYALLALVICMAALSALALVAPTADAQGEYRFIEPLPGSGGSIERGPTLLSDYLVLVWNSSLIAAAILAVLMIVVGGAQYIFTAVNPSQKSAARERIGNAIAGLLIVLSAYLILWTINPDLVANGVLDLPPIGADADRTLPGYTPAGESEVRDLLKRNGIDINKDPCPPPRPGAGCTEVGGFQQHTIDGVLAIAEGCAEMTLPNDPRGPCEITVTGGTEPGHAGSGEGTHSGGDKADFRPTGPLNDYILLNTELVRNDADIGNGLKAPLRKGEIDGQCVIVIDEREKPKASHWDVEFTGAPC